MIPEGYVQQPNVASQRAAMQKLDFLVRTWSGPETVITGSGAPLMLTVAAQGFTWGYGAGAMRVSNTMQLNANGEWTETTETTMGSSPPRLRTRPGT